MRRLLPFLAVLCLAFAPTPFPKPGRERRPELTFQIRDPWNRGGALLVRLNIDRLRAYHLSKEDVMKAVTPSRLVDRKEPPPPPGVVFNEFPRPDPVENIILKANAEGDIVRLKDVAKVELLAGGKAQEAEPNAAADGGGTLACRDRSPHSHRGC